MLDKKANIFNSARELFCSKGFKDTSVSDITKMAGIGIGTFYDYYTSKEKLFLEIFLQELEKLKKSIIESVDMDDTPVKVAKEVSLLFFSGIDSNPILKEWYSLDVHNKLEQYYLDEGIKDEDDFYYNIFVELIKKWQATGKIKCDLNHEFILAFFTSLAYINIHKEEIGINYFPQLLDYFVEFITKGLTDG